GTRAVAHRLGDLRGPLGRRRGGPLPHRARHPAGTDSADRSAHFVTAAVTTRTEHPDPRGRGALVFAAPPPGAGTAPRAGTSTDRAGGAGARCCDRPALTWHRCGLSKCSESGLCPAGRPVVDSFPGAAADHRTGEGR